jgi:hypothetical protein
LPGLDEASHRYVRSVADRLQGELGERLVGVYLIGSAAFGDYVPGSSDLDVAAVVRTTLDDRTKERLVSRLSHEALPCPASMLELVVYPLAAAGGGSLRPAYELNLNTGQGAGTRFWIDAAGPGSEPPHWFVVDLATAGSHAVAILGPPPRGVFAPVPRRAVVRALHDVLDWQMANEPQAPNTVLNACRAWRWAKTGRWSSKREAGLWASAVVADPSPIDAAIAARRGEPRLPPDPEAVQALVATVRSALDSAGGRDA